LNVLTVANLRKSYGQLAAVRDVSFAIDSGEIFGLLGPNGAGKSTTINIISTLLAADSGQVVLCGDANLSPIQQRRLIGYVPQEISLAERMTARENLSLVGRLYDLAGANLKDRVAAMLTAVGLTERADDVVSTFSGGMKRRLNIAAGLLHEPKLVLLDEPTAGVDPQSRAYIFEIVERLAAEGRAVLYTTHYMEEAERLCARVGIVDHGQILAMGTLDELVNRVGAKRELILEMPGLTAQSAERLAARLGGATHSLDDGALRLTISSPEHALLSAVRAADELGLTPKSIRVDEPTLETVFLSLTGRALRD